MLEMRALAAINNLRADEQAPDPPTLDEKRWLVKAFHHLKQIDEGRSKARPGSKPYCIFDVDNVYVQFLASSIEKILCEARGSSPAEFATILLPNCSVRSRTGQHLAKAILENEQLIETCWYGIVREVIAVAEFRVRCFQPLSKLVFLGCVGAARSDCAWHGSRSLQPGPLSPHDRPKPFRCLSLAPALEESVVISGI